MTFLITHTQDLTAAACTSATSFCSQFQERVAQIMTTATQETEDQQMALEQEKEKRQRMEEEIKDIIENLEDLSIRQIKLRLKALIGDEDIPYPEPVRRPPPPTPYVKPFVNVSTQTDDEGGPVDRYI